MVGLAKVTYNGMDAGAVSLNKRTGLTGFEYFPAFVSNGLDISPIMMPVKRSQKRIYNFSQNRGSVFKGLPGLLSDSLPNGIAERALNLWLHSNGIIPEDLPSPDLLRIIGANGPGALEYEPDGPLSIPSPDLQDIEKLQWATNLLMADTHESRTQLINDKQLGQLASSFINSGQQGVAVTISLNHQSDIVHADQQVLPVNNSDWILMLTPDKQIKKTSGLGGKIAYATYLMALDCGIIAAECRLLDINDTSLPMFPRPDRTNDNGYKEGKIHIQSLSALGHIHPDNSETATYEKAFQIMREMKLPHSDAIQLFRRLIFSLLTGHKGDSPKTLRFTMNTMGQWSLAPAILYEETDSIDELSERSQIAPLAMSLQGKRDSLSIRDLKSVARHISLKNADDILEDMIDTVSHWDLYAEEAGLPYSATTSINQRFTKIRQALTE